MEAVLLAGGFGTRLRPLTYTRPKPLIPVAGRPMLEWVLDRLPAEVTKVIVAVNWQADALRAYFASKTDREYVVVVEDEPLGTAGAVKNCQEHLTSAQFFVLNADVLGDMDLHGMIAMQEKSGAMGTISLKEVAADDVVHYGVAELDGRRILGFVEKPATPADAPSRLINAGAYLLRREVIDLIPDGLVSMEKEIFPQLIPQGFCGVPFTGDWIDVGDPARLMSANLHYKGTPPAAQINANATLVSTFWGVDCIIGSARLESCLIGDRVRVTDGAVLRNVVIGDDEVVSGSHADTRIWTKPIPAGYPDKQIGNALH